MKVVNNRAGRSYALMMKDNPVCHVEYNPQRANIESIIHIDNPELLPLRFIVKDQLDVFELADWWKDRFAPKSRLPRTLQNSPGFAQLFNENLGMSLADHYWMLPQGSSAKWEDRNFYTNDFSEEVGRDLLGTGMRSKFKEGESLRNPSFTANGALPKFWRINRETGARQLCKASSPVGLREAENEVAISAALSELLAPSEFVQYHAEVINGKLWSVCDAFTDESHEYIPACDVLDDLAMDESSLGALTLFARRNGLDDFKDAIDKMLVVDALFANQDRHFGNFGFVRNVDTLKIERMAPIFDCGTSLWCPASEDVSFAPFSENVNVQLELVRDLSWVDETELSAAERAAIEKLSELGVQDETVEYLGELLEYQADIVLSERDDRTSLGETLASKVDRAHRSSTLCERPSGALRQPREGRER